MQLIRLMLQVLYARPRCTWSFLLEPYQTKYVNVAGDVDRTACIGMNHKKGWIFNRGGCDRLMYLTAGSWNLFCIWYFGPYILLLWMSKYCVSPEEGNCEKMFSFWDKIIGARYILPTLKRCTKTKICRIWKKMLKIKLNSNLRNTDK